MIVDDKETLNKTLFILHQDQIHPYDYIGEQLCSSKLLLAVPLPPPCLRPLACQHQHRC
eukprot:c4396_g2_i1 orf=2-175(-)